MSKLLSMTGFGSASREGPRGKLTIEVQSVNRKYFEVQVWLPKGFSRFEHDLRKVTSEALQRGAVTVRVTLTASGGALPHMLPNVALLKHLKIAWEEAATSLGLDPKPNVSLQFLVERLAGEAPFEIADESELALLQTCLQSALGELTNMRRKEGAALEKDLAMRLKGLEMIALAIEGKGSDATLKLRGILREKLREALGDGAPIDERLLREVALFAEKVDIAEELVRFRSHVEQYKQLLLQAATGRKMDFLIQEMSREINTIGSKSMDASIAHLVVEAKAELEKMREQVQNIL